MSETLLVAQGSLMNLYTQEASRQGFSAPLHALRGLAAIVVLFNHMHDRIEEAFPSFTTVAHIFNSSAAVVFFYVLSGLVVGASLAKVGVTYSSTAIYLQRRLFRIMPLMFVTVTIGGLYLLYVDPYMKYSLIPKAYGDFSLVKFVASYVGYSLKPNPPIWSIFVELVASLLIPLLILCGKSILGIVLTIVGCVILSLIPIEFQHHWNFYMISFCLGLTVLVWGRWFAARMAALPNSVFWGILALLFIAFYITRRITHAGFGDLWIVYWETLCVTPLVAMIYYMPERFSWLSGKMFKFLGDVSFSLYLTHFLLLVVLLNAITAVFGSSVFAAVLYCAACVVLSVAIALISYRHIELKGMHLGDGLRRQFKPAPDVS